MIYRYEGFYDPLRICLVFGYVEADSMKNALAQAEALVTQKAQLVGHRLDYCVITKLEETDIKIQIPKNRKHLAKEARV